MSQVFRKYGSALLFIALSVFAFPIFSQDKNINDVQKTANELFEQEKYLEAKDLYSQLVSLYPKDENFNYRFGACLLFVDEDKTYPLKFLEYAVSKPNVNTEAFYFLGKGYHYNYRFDEAISYFNKYKAKLDAKEKSKYPVENDIRHCENGKLLLDNITTPLVISKKKVSAADFFTSFKLTEMGGRMLYAPKELHSSVDKKNGYTPVMYKNENSNHIYFTSYGNTEKYGLDIFRVFVSDIGVIGKPVRLPDHINTEFDERFPFLTEDKSTFYFSSTGHTSMGGADIFSCTYDSASNTYTDPVNLDYSVNTPDDDFMYAEVGKDGIAFFASNRNCEKGKAYVYKINSKRKAFEIAVLAGVFNSDDTRSCKITVEDLDDHFVVGSFNTNKKSGEYVMRLKNGGRYSFLVEPFGGQTAYKGRVELPLQEDIKLLKQQIEIVKADGSEKLIIRNLFEEEALPEDQKVIAQVLVDNANIEEEKEPQITISGAEIISEIEKQAKKKEEKIALLQSQKNASFHLANKKRELAHKDLELADQLEQQISLNNQSTENLAKQKEFSDLVKDAKKHSDEAAIAYQMGEKYEKEISNTQTEINETSGYLSRIKEAQSNDNQAKVLDLYAKYSNEVAEESGDSYSKNLNKSLESQKKQMSNDLKMVDAIEKQQIDLKKEISDQKASLLATKKKKEKEAIQNQITLLESEVAPLAEEKERYLASASSHDAVIDELRTEKALYTELSESPPENGSSEMASDQKQAMLASINATSQEIAALEEATKESNNIASNSLPNETTENLESSQSALAENTIDTEDLIEPDPNAEIIEEAITENEAEIDVDPNTELETPVVTIAEEEVLANEESVNEVGEQALNEISTEGKEPVTSEEPAFFNYATEYEEPVDNVVLVEGQSVPLDITSNTGKLKYTETELAKAEVVLGKSEYNNEYQNQFSKTKTIEDRRSKARETQRINYNWVVSIEKEIAALEYAKTQNTNVGYKTNMDIKIEDLKDQATQKRNFMALNAKIIKQLDEQELAEQSNTSEESETDSNVEVGVAALNTELEANAENLEQTENESTNEEVEIAEVTEATSEESENNELVENSETENVGIVNNEATEINEPLESNEANESNAAEAELAASETLENQELPIAEAAGNIAPGGENENEENANTELAENAELELANENKEPTEGNELVEENEQSENTVNSESTENTAFEESQEVELPNETEALAETESQVASENNEELAEQNLSEIPAEIDPNSETEGEVEAVEVENEIAQNSELNQSEESTEEINEDSQESEDSSENEVTNETIEVEAELTPIQEAEISPSAAAIAQVEIEKENQEILIVTKQSEFEELQTELELTKKKKEKRIVANELAIKEAEVAYEKRKLQLVEQKKADVTVSQDAMISDPLSTRPSEAKFSEVRKLRSSAASLQSDLDDVEYTLSETKKKKQRRILEAEVISIKKELALANLETQMAQESAKEMQVVEQETLKKLTNYGTDVIVKLPEIETELTPEQVAQVEELDAYTDYMETKKQSEKQIQSASVLYESSNSKKQEVAQIEEEVSLLTEAIDLLPETEKDSVRTLIVTKKKQQRRLIAEAEVLYKEGKVLENGAYFNLNEANSDLLVLDDASERTLILTALNGKVATPEVAFDSTNIDVIPTNLSNDIFVDNDSTFYNESKPIPVNVSLPKGVILKVQIGAFRNPINPATFKGFAPIVGEKTGSGLTRYTAGLFKDFETANNAKNSIRSKGYSDAFVVAYLDGKRISISEARRVLAGEISSSDVLVQETIEPAPTQNEASVSVNEITTQVVTPGSGNVQVEEAKSRGNLYFTVQVGVYSNKIQPSSVLSITPLNSENIPNNLVRYSSGVYGSVSQASAARARIVQLGISDAFVTVYYQGKRISLAEARALIANGTVPSTGGQTGASNPVNTNPTSVSDNGDDGTAETGSFYVQVGPYSGGIPVEQAREILQLNALGVVVEKNNNATLYKIGNFTNREEAEAIKTQLESKGLASPTVIKNE